MIRILTVLAILAFSGPFAPAHAHAGDDPLRCSLLATASNYEAALQLHARMGTRSLTQYKNDIIARTEEFESQRLHPPIGESMIARAMAAMTPARRSAFQEWRLVMRSNPWRLPEYPLAEFLTAHRFETPDKKLKDVEVPLHYLLENLRWMQSSLSNAEPSPVLTPDLHEALNLLQVSHSTLQLRVRQLLSEPVIHYGTFVEVVADFLIFHTARTHTDVVRADEPNPDFNRLDAQRKIFVNHFSARLSYGISFITQRSLGSRDWSSELYPIAIVDAAVAYDIFHSDIMARRTAALLRGPLTFGIHDVTHTTVMMIKNQGLSHRDVMVGNFDELIGPEINRQWFHTWVSASIQGLSLLNLEASHSLEIENFYFEHETPSSIFSRYLTWYPREAGSITNHRGDRDDFELSYRQIGFYQDPSIPHYPNLPEAQRAEIRDLIYTWLELMRSLRSL